MIGIPQGKLFDGVACSIRCKEVKEYVGVDKLFLREPFVIPVRVVGLPAGKPPTSQPADTLETFPVLEIAGQFNLVHEVRLQAMRLQATFKRRALGLHAYPHTRTVNRGVLIAEVTRKARGVVVAHKVSPPFMLWIVSALQKLRISFMKTEGQLCALNR